MFNTINQTKLISNFIYSYVYVPPENALIKHRVISAEDRQATERKKKKAMNKCVPYDG